MGIGPITNDAFGRQAAKVVSDTGAGTTTRTVFVSVTRPIQNSPYAGQVVSEYESVDGIPTAVSRKYTYAAYIDEPLTLFDVGQTSETAYYYHGNHLHCVAAMTDNSAGVVERYGYKQYGKATILAPDATTVRSGSAIANTFCFTGRRYVSETGLYYFRARYYDCALGCFIGRDPLEYIAGVDLYGAYFVPGSVDPAGLCDLPPITNIVGGTVFGAIAFPIGGYGGIYVRVDVTAKVGSCCCPNGRAGSYTSVTGSAEIGVYLGFMASSAHFVTPMFENRSGCPRNRRSSHGGFTVRGVAGPLVGTCHLNFSTGNWSCTGSFCWTCLSNPGYNLQASGTYRWHLTKSTC